MRKKVIHPLLNRLLMSVLLFTLLPFCAQAASTSAGLSKDSVWFSQDPFFAGERVVVFVLVYNSNSKEMKGVLELFDGTTKIGTREFSIKGEGGSEVVEFPWDVAGGNHAFSIKIVGPVFVNGEEETEASLGAGESTKIERFADIDTDFDRVGNTTDPDDDNDGVSDVEEKKLGTDPLLADTDGDGILDGADERPLAKDAPPDIKTDTAVTKIEKTINAYVPDMLAQALPAIGYVEDFRERQGGRATTFVNEVQKQFPQAATSKEGDVKGIADTKPPSGWEIWKAGVTSKEVIRSPLAYAKLFFALVLQFLTTNVYAFYALALVLVIQLFRFLIGIFR